MSAPNPRCGHGYDRTYILSSIMTSNPKGHDMVRTHAMGCMECAYTDEGPRTWRFPCSSLGWSTDPHSNAF